MANRVSDELLHSMIGQQSYQSAKKEKISLNQLCEKLGTEDPMPFTGMNEPKFMPQLSNNNTSLLPNRNFGMGAFNNQSSFNLGNTSMQVKDMKLSDMKLGDMKLGKLGTSSLNNSVIQALNKNQNTFDTVNPALNTSLFGNFNEPGFYNRKSTLRKAPSKDYRDNENPFDQMLANR